MIDEDIVVEVLADQDFFKNPGYFQRLMPNGYIGQQAMQLDLYALESEIADVFTDRRFEGPFFNSFKRDLTHFNTCETLNEQSWEMSSAGNTFLRINDDMQESHSPYALYRTPHYQDVVGDVVGFGVYSDIKVMFDAATEPAVQLALKMSTQFT